MQGVAAQQALAFELRTLTLLLCTVFAVIFGGADLLRSQHVDLLHTRTDLGRSMAFHAQSGKTTKA